MLELQQHQMDGFPPRKRVKQQAASGLEDFDCYKLHPEYLQCVPALECPRDVFENHQGADPEPPAPLAPAHLILPTTGAGKCSSVASSNKSAAATVVVSLEQTLLGNIKATALGADHPSSTTPEMSTMTPDRILDKLVVRSRRTLEDEDDSPAKNVTAFFLSERSPDQTCSGGALFAKRTNILTECHCQNAVPDEHEPGAPTTWSYGRAKEFQIQPPPLGDGEVDQISFLRILDADPEGAVFVLAGRTRVESAFAAALSGTKSALSGRWRYFLYYCRSRDENKNNFSGTTSSSTGVELLSYAGEIDFMPASVQQLEQEEIEALQGEVEDMEQADENMRTEGQQGATVEADSRKAEQPSPSNTVTATSRAKESRLALDRDLERIKYVVARRRKNKTQENITDKTSDVAVKIYLVDHENLLRSADATLPCSNTPPSGTIAQETRQVLLHPSGPLLPDTICGLGPRNHSGGRLLARYRKHHAVLVHLRADEGRFTVESDAGQICPGIAAVCDSRGGRFRRLFFNSEFIVVVEENTKLDVDLMEDESHEDPTTSSSARTLLLSIFPFLPNCNLPDKSTVRVAATASVSALLGTDLPIESVLHLKDISETEMAFFDAKTHKWQVLKANNEEHAILNTVKKVDPAQMTAAENDEDAILPNGIRKAALLQFLDRMEE
ncbi:unnamed protein product [Amoebophrya sp. A120]|nr:unnamed protein product [Amoebophrya sp. A120]|eukprot:GSA120T00018515001.1